MDELGVDAVLDAHLIDERSWGIRMAPFPFGGVHHDHQAFQIIEIRAPSLQPGVMVSHVRSEMHEERRRGDLGIGRGNNHPIRLLDIVVVS